jgi:hypothetical protein
MSLALPKICSLGSSQTGLVGTIGITLLNPDGSTHTARTTAGIYEIGGGYYGKDISFPDNWKGVIKWDTGGGSPVYMCEVYTTDGLLDAAEELQQSLSFGKEVIIDTANGVAGTTFPTGTRSQPSNNLTDTLAICAARGLIRIMTRSDLTIEPTHNIDRIVIATHGIMGTDVVFQSGCSAQWATLRNINVSGVLTNGDVLLIEDCSIGDLANFTGIMNVCAFGEGCEISLGPWANLIECYCGGEPANEPEISLNTSALSMPCYCGNLKFTNKTGGPSTVASFRSGSVSIASSCIAGKIKILGTGELEKDESGPGCTVDVDAALTNEFIADHVWDELAIEHNKVGSFGKLLNFVHHIEGGRWKIDKVLNQMVFYDETNAIEVARFDLKDAVGQAVHEDVFERIRV